MGIILLAFIALLVSYLFGKSPRYEIVIELPDNLSISEIQKIVDSAPHDLSKAHANLTFMFTKSNFDEINKNELLIHDFSGPGLLTINGTKAIENGKNPMTKMRGLKC